jgi:hypothetical protein
MHLKQDTTLYDLIMCGTVHRTYRVHSSSPTQSFDVLDGESVPAPPNGLHHDGYHQSISSVVQCCTRLHETMWEQMGKNVPLLTME